MLITFFQDKLLFPLSKVMDRDPGAFGWEYEDLHLDVDGYKTHGWYIPIENARGTVIFSHGNAGNLAGRLESISLLRHFKLNVLAYDYGGYGHSTGKPGEERIYNDIRAMWLWLTEVKGTPADEIVLFGRSMGGGPTAQLATEVDAAAVILESTFSSVPDAAKHHMPFVPRFLVRHKFATVDKVANINSPLLVIHSHEDTLLPHKFGQAIFDAATEPKTFVEILGDHNVGFVESKAIYIPAWEKFLKGVLPRE